MEEKSNNQPHIYAIIDLILKQKSKFKKKNEFEPDHHKVFKKLEEQFGYALLCDGEKFPQQIENKFIQFIIKEMKEQHERNKVSSQL